MTIVEFRANLKDAFDQAEAGQTVTITRKGRVFVLKLAEVVA